MECAEILGMGLGGARPPPHKKNLKWRVLVHSQWYFSSVSSAENVEFPAGSDLVDVD